MRLYKGLFIFGSILLLNGCGNADPIEDKPVEKPKEEEVTAEEPNIEEVNEENPIKKESEEKTMEIDSEQPLENIGEYKYTIQGRAELLDINRPKETFKFIEGVDINFKDIKVLYLSEIPENEKEFFKEVYGFDDEGYSVQFSYSVTNDTDQTVGGIEILDIVTSNGNQYNIYNDGGPVQRSAYEVRPGATANVGVIFSVEDPNIDYLNLYFQPIDKDGYHLDETSMEIKF